MLAGAKVMGGPGGTGGTYTKCVAGDVAQVATQCWSRSPPSCSSSAMATGWTASVANSDGYCQENSGRPPAKTRSNRWQHNSFSVAYTHDDLLLCELALVKKHGNPAFLTRSCQCSFLVQTESNSPRAAFANDDMHVNQELTPVVAIRRQILFILDLGSRLPQRRQQFDPESSPPARLPRRQKSRKAHSYPPPPHRRRS